jgi:hypothetical protein
MAGTRAYEFSPSDTWARNATELSVILVYIDARLVSDTLNFVNPWLELAIFEYRNGVGR